MLIAKVKEEAKGKNLDSGIFLSSPLRCVSLLSVGVKLGWGGCGKGWEKEEHTKVKVHPEPPGSSR